MKKHSLLLFILLILVTQTNKAADIITLETLLDEMISFDNVTKFPIYISGQQSSYDRKSKTPGNADWFTNSDGFGWIRTEENNGRTEKVLFEQSAPGVITRIWLTTNEKNGTIRFYFDGNKEPDWVITGYDMTKFGLPCIGKGLCQPHTSYQSGTDTRGGSTFFMPIPYSKSCKVTYEDPKSDVPRYYHFNYRKYPENTQIETFSQEVADRAKEKIILVNNRLLNPPSFGGGEVIKKCQALSENNSIECDLPTGVHAVRRLNISVKNIDNDIYQKIMRQIVIQAEFDGKKTVWVPLSDFSGAGYGAPAVKSWYMTADGRGNIESRWIMPYKKNGKIKIINYSKYEVDVDVTIHIGDIEWDDNTLYFHSSWKQEVKIPFYPYYQPEKCKDWNFAYITGKGVFVGDVLSLFNHAPSWYGEGDEKIWVDDETFPSHFGTGTEDYYNSSWAPVVPFDTPFGGAPRADLPSSHAYNTFFRTRNLDGIPFNHKFKFDIEMMGWQEGKSDYATTIYWYGEKNAELNNTSGINEVLRIMPANPKDFKYPNSAEFETKNPTEKTSRISIETQDMSGYTNDRWSNCAQTLCRNAQINDYIKYTFSGFKNKKYRVMIRMTKAIDYGIVSVSVNNNIPVMVDCYNNGVINTGSINLGDYIPQNGNFEITIKLTGKNTSSTGTLIGLDCIQIVETNFKMAMR